MIKILNSIDITDILAEYHRLEHDIQWTSMGHKGKQAGLQYKIETDPWNGFQSSVDPETNKPWTKTAWDSAVGRNRGMELDYHLLNPYFKDTIFEKLISDYKMYRTRFMWVNRMSCYSVHKDSTPRIHIPSHQAFQLSTLSHLSSHNRQFLPHAQSRSDLTALTTSAMTVQRLPAAPSIARKTSS